MNYSAKDLYYLFHPYFSIICFKPGSCEIRSNNTGHYWNILPEDGYYHLYHKHKESDLYHPQTFCGSIQDSLLYIIDHDEYVLKRNHVYLSDCPQLFQEIINAYASKPL